MVRLANPGWRVNQSTPKCDRRNKKKSGQQTIDGYRLESRGGEPDGTSALPRNVPILCAGGQTELSALSAERGSVHWRAFQYCILRIANEHGGCRVRSRTR